MYSTVGTSEVSCRSFGVFGVKCGKGVVEVCGNDLRAGDKRRERCSEDGGGLHFLKILAHNCGMF